MLREVLPIDATDGEAFAHARANGMITITCNRDDYLVLAGQGFTGVAGTLYFWRARVGGDRKGGGGGAGGGETVSSAGGV